MHTFWHSLQLFADGDAAPAADTGGQTTVTTEATVSTPTAETAGAADQGLLRNKGFNESQIRKIQKYEASRAKQTPAAAPTEQVQQKTETQQDTAPAKVESPVEEKTQKQSLKELLKSNPEYNAEMQQMMQGRLKESKGKAANFDKMERAIQVLAKKHGMDVTNLDYDKLSEAIANDDDNIAEEVQATANQYGLDYDAASDIVKQKHELEVFREREAERQKQEELTIEQEMHQKHIQGLVDQSAKLKEKYPDFDFWKEMENPYFRNMTSPQINLPVEYAYRAIHPELDQQIAAQAMQQAKSQIAQSIQSGSRRPVEAGASSQSPSSAKFDYASASKSQREQFKAGLKKAWARGEKVYPQG